MTFSLVAYDEAAHSCGSLICSSSPAVAARCAHLADGPVHSAGLSVVAGYGRRVTDLRVDWSGAPGDPR